MDTQLTDRFRRPLRDLRISVTDRCNFRCTYCMPSEIFGRDFQFLAQRELLTFEEIARLARLFTLHGAEKIRITGGEPLLRRELETLIAMLAGIEGVRDLTMTTNGSLLAAKSSALKASGLSRVTVSLDSLDEAIFQSMNGADFPVARVLEGIEAAGAAGLGPVKINMVVKRGVNDGGVLEMARFFKRPDTILRFIEYMDVGTSNDWKLEEVVPAAEIIKTIDAEFPLEAIDPQYTGEVASRYRYKDGEGEIGVIASVTRPFCGNCNRARISSEGKLFTCLFATEGHDLRALLRQGAPDDEISAHIGRIWGSREDRYSEIRASATTGLPKVEMSYIGG